MKRLSLFVLVTLLAVASFAQAEKKKVEPSKQFSGSVEDEKLSKDAPVCIASAKELEKIWTSWKVGDKMPDVDFKKEIVVIQTTVGSKLNLISNLDTDKGDLQVLAFGTKDLRPGFRYVIGVVSREGVKTVNGKELPKE